jgi:outer membrane protein assembly factor BamB
MSTRRVVGSLLVLFGCSSEPSRSQPSSAAVRCERGHGPDLAALSFPEQMWSYQHANTMILSVRAEDLDGDGEPELIAAHGIETPPSGGVIALASDTGEPLWEAKARQQLYGSPVFLDVTGDGVKDVFVGGRNAEFLGIDGSSGQTLWQFYPGGGAREQGWFNFYTAVPIPDQTGDEVPDLLVANGGYDLGVPFMPRPPGHLIVLDAKTGAIVVSAMTPDRQETYMSPLVVVPGGGSASAASADSLTVLFGTGGETLPGGLWKASLSSLLAGSLDQATPLVSSSVKGVVAPPSLADVNADGTKDILVVTFDGRLLAIDGVSEQPLWEQTFSDSESYSSPTLGFFDDDPVPDLFVTFLRGQFPEYSGALHAIVAGRDGAILWQAEAGNLSMAGDVAADLDGDGIDEVIFMAGDTGAAAGSQEQLHLLDSAQRSSRPWGAPFGAVLPVSPWLGELDQDGCLDLVVPQLEMGIGTSHARLVRLRVGAPTPRAISWGGYLGTHFDATFSR